MGALTGAELMSIVAEYDALGVHRTGDRAERPTADWLADRIARLGGHAELHSYEFERYVAEWEVRVDGEPVDSLPLWYSGEADLRGVRVPIVAGSVASAAAEHQRFVDEEQLLGPATGPALAVATAHPDGHLVALNRTPRSATTLPVVCVRGDTIEQSSAPVAEIDLRATTGPDVGWNVVGHFGGSASRRAPLLIVTPSSGWFHCAGERGTGIAAALGLAHAVVERADGEQPVVLLATSGHEIGHLGALAAASLVPDEIAAIVHVGASVAARAGRESDELTPFLVARTNAAGERGQAVGKAIAPLGVRLDVPVDPTDPAQWIGESRRWASTGRPLLSLTGRFPEFHTPADRTDVTSPTLLATVTDGLIGATVGLLI